MHPSARSILQFFSYEHLPARLQAVSKPIAELAERMAHELPSNAETTVGLRKLLEAKDCFVRAQVAVDAPSTPKPPQGGSGLMPKPPTRPIGPGHQVENGIVGCRCPCTCGHAGKCSWCARPPATPVPSGGMQREAKANNPWLDRVRKRWEAD